MVMASMTKEDFGEGLARVHIVNTAFHLAAAQFLFVARIRSRA
jgi:hypothetical protein